MALNGEKGPAPAPERSAAELEAQPSGAQRSHDDAGASPDTAGAPPETAGVSPDTAGASPDTAGASPDTAGASPVDEVRQDESPPRGRPAPLWIAGLYLGGLVLVFLAQRVLVTVEKTSLVVTGLGLAAVAVGTMLRFSPRFRVGGERRQIEQVLGVLSVLGLLGLVVWFTSTEFMLERLGLLTLDAVSLERIEGILHIVWVLLVAVSVIPMIFAEAAAWPMRHAERPESRRVRAAAGAGFVLVVAALYGAFFMYAARGLDWKVDYSYFKTSRPSEPTLKIAQSLSEPVVVRAFYPDVNEVRAEVLRYLEGVAASAPQLKIEIQDRLLVPKLARDLRVTQDGVIVLTQGDAHEQLRVGTELKDAAQKLRVLDRDFQEKLLKLARSRRTAYLTVGHGELNDTSAAKQPERAASVIRTLLQRQNYAVKDLGVVQGLGQDVPADADVVLVLGPAEPFAPEELTALRRYAKRGGKLFLALDPDAETSTAGVLPDEVGAAAGATAPGSDSETDAGAPAPDAAHRGDGTPEDGVAEPGVGDAPSPTPSTGIVRDLEALASVVGLTFSPALIENEQSHLRLSANASDRTRIFTNRFSSHASVSTLSRTSGQSAIFLFGAGSLESAPGSETKADFTIRSMPNSFADTNRDFRHQPGEKRDTFNLAAAVTAASERQSEPSADPAAAQPDKDGGPEHADAKHDARSEKNAKKAKGPGVPQEMRAFVVADANALSDFVLTRSIYNQVMFVDALRWMVGEESFAGEDTTEEDLRIEHTKQEDLVWFYSTIFGMPALVLGIGLVLGGRLNLRRRGKRA